MINLINGTNTFLIYGDFQNIVANIRLKFFNGFDKIERSVTLWRNENDRFAEYSFDVNTNVVNSHTINDLPYGNYDYILTTSVGGELSRGQLILKGSTEIRNVEYISDNETSESIIYVS
jgi:hypothetical protein